METKGSDAMQEYRRQKEMREARLQEPRDGDDLDLTLLVNDYWKKASFGYPIQDDVRKASTVAEMIQADAQRQGEVLSDEEGRRQRKMFVGKHYRFDAMAEYEKLFKLFEDGQQKVRELGHIQQQERLYQTKVKQVMRRYRNAIDAAQKTDDPVREGRKRGGASFSPLQTENRGLKANRTSNKNL